MTSFIIIDLAHGTLQWSGLAESGEAAFATFADEIGGEGLDADNYRISEVTPEQRAAVEAWWEAGAAAGDFPL